MRPCVSELLVMLDGAHCLRVLCAHPCCWDTEHRCARGLSRLTPARVRRRSSKDPLTDSFPSLSVVDVCEWAGWRRAVKERALYSTDTEAALNDVSLSKQTTDTERIKREEPSFPESISSTTTNKLNKLKLSTVAISPLMGCCEFPQCPVWIPNPNHHPRRIHQNQSTFPNIAIKELTCFPSRHLSKPSVVVNLRKRFHVGKWRAQRCRNSPPEGAVSSQWVGIGFNPIPKIGTHAHSHGIPFKDSGSKLPHLSTPNPNPAKHSSLSPSVGSVKSWRGN